MRIDHFHFVPFTALKFVGVCSKHLRKSTEIFGNLLKTSEMFGLPTKFKEPSGIFEKWLEILGKFPKTTQCIVRILSKKYYGRLEVQNFSSRAEEHFNTQKEISYLSAAM